MPAIYELVVLINLNRRQDVEDICVLRDEVVVALAEPRVQIVRSTTASSEIICGVSITALSHDAPEAANCLHSASTLKQQKQLEGYLAEPDATT